MTDNAAPRTPGLEERIKEEVAAAVEIARMAPCTDEMAQSAVYAATRGILALLPSAPGEPVAWMVDALILDDPAGEYAERLGFFTKPSTPETFEDTTKYRVTPLYAGAAPAEREGREDAEQYMTAIINGDCGNPRCGCCDADAALARLALRALAPEQGEPRTYTDHLGHWNDPEPPAPDRIAFTDAEIEALGGRRFAPPAPGETREGWMDGRTLADPDELHAKIEKYAAPTSEAARLADAVEWIICEYLDYTQGKHDSEEQEKLNRARAAARLLRGEKQP